MRVRTFGVCIGVMVTLLVTSAGAFAQRPGGGRGGFGGRGGMQLSVAQVPAVVLEQPLQLTADQKEKITSIQTKVREDMRALFQQGGQGGQGQRGANMQKLQELNTKAGQDIEALLTADQKAKLPELLKKLQTLRAVGIPLEVAPDLKLTDDQTAKLQKLVDDFQAKMREAMQAAGANGGNGGGAGAFQQFRTMRQDLQKQGREVLTDEQKTTLDQYLKDHPQAQFGQRGQRGRRQGGGAGQ